jgi:hypothetical protein
MGAALAALTIRAERQAKSWAGARYVPDPKDVGSEKQHYKAAKHRASE